jgi:hypothetical protein
VSKRKNWQLTLTLLQIMDADYERDDLHGRASFLYPWVARGDLGDVLKRELRQRRSVRERIMRQAAKHEPPRRPAGFADLTPGRFVTALAVPPEPQRVNGHALDVSMHPFPQRNRDDAE